MGYLLVWTLIVAALWLIHFSSVNRENKLSRSPILPQAGARSPLPLAPAPLSANWLPDEVDAQGPGRGVPARQSQERSAGSGSTSQSRPRAGEPTAHGALPLSAGELQAMEINREAVERLYGGAA